MMVVDTWKVCMYNKQVHFVLIPIVTMPVL